MTAIDVGVLRAPRTATQGPAIGASRARGLARWNAALTVLHFLQFVLMVAISRTEAAFTAAVGYAVPRLEGGRFVGLEVRSAEVISVPLAYIVASFLLMSA